jgi:TusA-related sulfurtransferase
LKTKSDYILDLRGAIPPITLLKVSQVFREMRPKEILEILCKDADTRCDLFKVLPLLAYEVLDIGECAEDISSFRVLIRKR